MYEQFTHLFRNSTVCSSNNGACSKGRRVTNVAVRARRAAASRSSGVCSKGRRVTKQRCLLEGPPRHELAVRARRAAASRTSGACSKGRRVTNQRCVLEGPPRHEQAVRARRAAVSRSFMNCPFVCTYIYIYIFIKFSVCHVNSWCLNAIKFEHIFSRDCFSRILVVEGCRGVTTVRGCVGAGWRAV